MQEDHAGDKINEDNVREEGGLFREKEETFPELAPNAVISPMKLRRKTKKRAEGTTRAKCVSLCPGKPFPLMIIPMTLSQL